MFLLRKFFSSLRTFIGKSWNHSNKKTILGGRGGSEDLRQGQIRPWEYSWRCPFSEWKNSWHFGRTLRLGPQVWRDSKALFCLEYKLKIFLKRGLRGGAASLPGRQQQGINRETWYVTRRWKEIDFLRKLRFLVQKEIYICGLKRKLNIQIVVFWGVTPCSLVCLYRYLGGRFCLLHRLWCSVLWHHVVW